MSNGIAVVLMVCVTGCIVAQDVDPNIDRVEKRIIELITDYNTHERALSNQTIFYVPWLGAIPEPMTRDDLVEYLLEMKIYRGVDAQTVLSEALQFNNAYKEQLRLEFLPFLLSDMSERLNELANYLENKDTPLSEADKAILLKMSLALDEFSRKDSIQDNPAIMPALERALRAIDNPGGRGNTQPAVDTTNMDKILGDWDLEQAGEPTVVINIYLDEQLGSYCGRIMTPTNLEYYSQGDVIWRDIHFEKTFEDDWEVERSQIYRFKGIEKFHYQGEWHEGEVTLDLDCQVYNESGPPTGCTTLRWGSGSHGYKLTRQF
jgi:hypothetical protein